MGAHLTLCFKDSQHLASGTHVASHGYVERGDSIEITTATHAGEKPDAFIKKSGQVVWPEEHKLVAVPDIGYGHFPEQMGPNEYVPASLSAPWQTESNTQVSPSSTTDFTTYNTGAFATTDTTSYNTEPTTLYHALGPIQLPEDTPLVKVKIKGNAYQFDHNGKRIGSTAADWENSSIVRDGQAWPCLAYTGKKSGNRWFTWELPAK